ncbi:LysM peptidoglycan-binding domain-containing protein [Leuconostocaceae bacterium ESL0958]|nr:LysM peptidoglycan-binding domain-containing protein [Leuconostocaceae bacterium ESL0958]
MNIKKTALFAAGLAGSVLAGQQVAHADQGQSHTIQAGDTLTAIAKQYNLTVTDLARQNNIQNLDQIFTGEQLVIGQAQQPAATATPVAAQPAAQTDGQNYTVQAGDNLWTLAQRFHVSVAQLAQLNHIANPDALTIGQVLQLQAPSQLAQTTAAADQGSAQKQTPDTNQQAPASADNQQATMPTAAAAEQAAPVTASANTASDQAQATAVAATPANNQAAAQPAVATAPAANTENSDENQALQEIIRRESSGNVHARNGIYFGLGQLSPDIQRRFGGASTDYQDQLQAMQKYIASRYGSAQKALQHHNQYHWY